MASQGLYLQGSVMYQDVTKLKIMAFTDTSEKGFQKLILRELCTKNAFELSFSSDFDKEFCNNPKQLLSFIENTHSLMRWEQALK